MRHATSEMSRRRFGATALSALALPLIAGCETTSFAARGPGKGAGNAALLLPISGTNAAIGAAMAQAASLAGLGRTADALPRTYDSSDTPEGAATAARAALAAGAQMLLGPLRSDQTPAVLEVAGSVPVVTFSNDDRLADAGAFVFGVTAAQSVSAMFSYALAQGIRRVAVVASPGALGAATSDAAVRIAAAGGLNLSATLLRDPTAPGLVQALREASGIDELRPHEHPGQYERRVLEVVHPLVLDGVVVGRRDVPGRRDSDPEEEADDRPEQEREKRSEWPESRE